MPSNFHDSFAGHPKGQSALESVAKPDSATKAKLDIVGRILIKRVYDPVAADDGCRVLVDRIWPRGKTKEAVACQLWAKEVTPSTGLRKAFHSGAVTPAEFAHLYRAELDENPGFPAFADTAGQYLTTGNITLVTAAQLVRNGHCEVLKAALENSLFNSEIH